ncbi:MAG TPA: DEAD/DEAH box helicase, partial [Candidatus Hydrogenedentes bacterium]|nr:DEAD/DEAH box helicase [Candidatus Hydrogenedentota bacterium]
VAVAQTGTGKTLAFALPSLSRLAAAPRGRNSMLVLTPTRELAVQIRTVIEPFGNALGLRTVCLYGGVGLGPQTEALRRGCNIIVATPGRLLDHMARGAVSFRDLRILVLDEADRMLDMGFLPDIRRILAKLPAERQTLMFSATFPREIARLAADMQRNPARIEVGAVARPVETVRQNIYTVAQTGKTPLLSTLLRGSDVHSALVFLRTKHRTDRVARSLHKEGFKVQAIHGNRSQSQRQQALDGFRKGRYNVLVATDVAARGLDIKGVSHVINYDVPNTSDEYIHRIGRTARASESGDAITFVSPDECVALGNIETALGMCLPRVEWEGAVNVVSLYQTARKPQGPDRHGNSQRKRRLFRRR